MVTKMDVDFGHTPEQICLQLVRRQTLGFYRLEKETRGQGRTCILGKWFLKFAGDISEISLNGLLWKVEHCLKRLDRVKLLLLNNSIEHEDWFLCV